MSLRNLFANTAARFVKNEDGSFAVVFAISMGVILMGVGYAMDMSRTVTAKNQVQDVADVAALTAARAPNTTDAELREIADAVFVQHLGAGADALTARLDMERTVPMDAMAYRIDLVLRGPSQSVFENRPEGA